MLIEDVQIAVVDRDRVDLRALCGGRPLHYSLPASRFCRQSVGDALVLSVLAPAMRAGSTIRLPPDIPVSSQLATNLDAIQRIWMSWNAGLHKVRLEASFYEPAPASEGVGLFYAGGVDSSYSLISHLDEVDALIVAFGFDFTMSPDDMKKSIDRNGRFAHDLGKDFIQVETNHSRFVSALGISRTFVFGATLACMGLLLGLKRCLIASSHTVAYMRPEGSHPLLDYRFSNGVTEFIHDDVAVSRLDKTWAVATRPDVLRNLRVCWENSNENCGACYKCLRTMTALQLRGVSGPFPPLEIRRVKAMAAHTECEYVVSMLMAARHRGNQEIALELGKGLRRQDWKEALRYIDQALCGGRLRRLRRRFLDDEAHLVKVDLRPDLDVH